MQEQNNREDSIKLMLAAKCHLGSTNCAFHMQPYVFTRSKNGTHIINLGMTWEKIKLASRMIVAVDEPRDILAISQKPFGQRAVHKFSQFLGCCCINQRFTPGVFTNHSIEGKYIEPRLIIVCDPNTDQQAIHEAAYANIPCIALCDTDAHLEYVDCVIPCNTKNKTSIGLVMWLLTREVLRLKGELPRSIKWSVLPDLFFYRDASDEQKIQNMIDAEGEGVDETSPEAAPAAANAAPTQKEWENAGDGDHWNA